MNTLASADTLSGRKTLLPARTLYWLVFGLYLALMVCAMLHHELWGDELHSWNLAKASDSFGALIYNRRYEGHPPFWHILLWLLTRCTHNPLYMQWLHLVIAASAVWMVLFYAPFNALIKILIPFGYYFLFEYALLSRNYIPGVSAAFLLCIVLKKDFRYKLPVYYVLLLVMSQTHVLSMLLAGCLHVYLLLTFAEQGKRRALLLHLLAAIPLFLLALYLIIPPADSDMALGSWTGRWHSGQLALALQSPLRAFLPLPAWWTYSFWNRQCILELNAGYRALRWISPLIALGLVLLAAYVLKGDRKSLWVFLANLVLTLIIGNIYPLTTQRYTGFIFIGFLVACWLYKGRPFCRAKHMVLAALLVFQVIAGLFVVYKDIRLPFSRAYAVKELLAGVPPGETIVADYWALSAVAGYADTAIYCVDIRKKTSFILWGSDMMAMGKDPHRYYNGLQPLFRQKKIKQVYLVSTSSPGVLSAIDPMLFPSFKVSVVECREGAIEKWSNLYLYCISLP